MTKDSDLNELETIIERQRLEIKSLQECLKDLNKNKIELCDANRMLTSRCTRIQETADRVKLNLSDRLFCAINYAVNVLEHGDPNSLGMGYHIAKIRDFDLPRLS